jgi:hypothetical protein
MTSMESNANLLTSFTRGLRYTSYRRQKLIGLTLLSVSRSVPYSITVAILMVSSNTVAG